MITAPLYTNEMTEREQRIWDAAYAAAFVSELRAMWESCNKIDRAFQTTHAELAISIANLTVYRLRQWRSKEEESAGVTVNNAEQKKYYDE